MKHSNRLKEIIVQAKALRGLARLPNQPSRPKVDPKKQEEYDSYWAANPSKETARFFSQPYTVDETRRTARS